MNMIQDNKILLFACLLVLVSLILVSVSVVLNKLFRGNAFQIKHIVVVGDYSHVDIQTLEVGLKPYMRAGFFNLNTEAVKRIVSASPWIKNARISKVWPDKLRIEIEQKRILARWMKGGYVSEEGRVFAPGQLPVRPPETLFSGNKNQLLEMVAMYNKLSGILQRYGKEISVETLDEFGNLEIKTRNGEVYYAGSRKPVQTIKKYFKKYQDMLARKSRKKAVAVVDMRYDNGFSVKWKEL